MKNKVIDLKRVSHLPRGVFLRLFTNCSLREALREFERTEKRQPDQVYQICYRNGNESEVQYFIR
jgi:hypothetical protein